MKGKHFRICNLLVSNEAKLWRRVLENVDISSFLLLRWKDLVESDLLTLADWVLNLSDLLGCLDLYRRPKWRGTSCPTILRIATSLEGLNNIENMPSVSKCVEIKLPSISWLNNLKRFVICLHTKDLLFDFPRHGFTISGQIYKNVKLLSGSNLKKRKKIKSTAKIYEAATLFQQLWKAV